MGRLGWYRPTRGWRVLPIVAALGLIASSLATEPVLGQGTPTRAPWRQFTTNSIGFNGGGLTSATLRLLGNQRLVQLDAYNGGQTSSTITLRCAGLPTLSVDLAAGQLQTLVTGWQAPCATVTVTSSNGWDTNFDNLILAPPSP